MGIVRTALLLFLCASSWAQYPPSIEGVALPKPDVGFGLFYTPARFANETLYLAAMRDKGLNTVAPQCRPLANQPSQGAAGDLARELNNAALCGLMDTRFPVVCYSVGPADVVAAKALRNPRVAWPELVVQSIDEPNATQEATLKQYHEEAHKAGLRIGTAVAGYVCTGYTEALPWCEPKNVGHKVPSMGRYLDLWVVLVGTLSEDVYDLAKELGAQVGSYLAYPSSPILDRWTFGLWAWRAQTKINLAWAAINPQTGWDYSRIQEVSPWQFNPSGMDGLAEGVLDYRVLQAVRDLHSEPGRKWLKAVEAQTTLGWWPRGYVAKNQDKEAPTVDIPRVRTEGLRLVAETRRLGR